jgi:flagellar biosynthesis anti-sigma factor FlgM
MVGKITDSQGLTGTSGTHTPIQKPIQSSTQQAATQPQPAAKIGLSASALAAQHQVDVQTQLEAQGPLDSELVREIRERIATGRFKIDYDHVASNLLREAVASTQRHPAR